MKTFSIDDMPQENFFQRHLLVAGSSQDKNSLFYEPKRQFVWGVHVCLKGVRWIFRWDTHLGKVQQALIKAQQVAMESFKKDENPSQESIQRLMNVHQHLFQFQKVVDRHNRSWLTFFLFWTKVSTSSLMCCQTLDQKIRQSLEDQIRKILNENRDQTETENENSQDSSIILDKINRLESYLLAYETWGSKQNPPVKIESVRDLFLNEDLKIEWNGFENSFEQFLSEAVENFTKNENSELSDDLRQFLDRGSSLKSESLKALWNEYFDREKIQQKMKQQQDSLRQQEIQEKRDKELFVSALSQIQKWIDSVLKCSKVQELPSMPYDETWNTLSSKKHLDVQFENRTHLFFLYYKIGFEARSKVLSQLVELSKSVVGLLIKEDDVNPKNIEKAVQSLILISFGFGSHSDDLLKKVEEHIATLKSSLLHEAKKTYFSLRLTSLEGEILNSLNQQKSHEVVSEQIDELKSMVQTYFSSLFRTNNSFEKHPDKEFFKNIYNFLETSQTFVNDVEALENCVDDEGKLKESSETREIFQRVSKSPISKSLRASFHLRWTLIHRIPQLTSLVKDPANSQLMPRYEQSRFPDSKTWIAKGLIPDVKKELTKCQETGYTFRVDKLEKLISDLQSKVEGPESLRSP